MTRSEADAVEDFVRDLEMLRRNAGQPSLNRLVELSARLVHPLARSTISDKLNVKSLPEWDFVVSFVTACAAHASDVGVALDPTTVDLGAWDAKHLRMLTLVDAARRGDRLSAAAADEIALRAGARGAVGPVVPRQLPPIVVSFVGRASELDLLRYEADRGVGVEGATPIVSIHGAAGIGKTSLALHFAHLVATAYPDGQLYVDLRGYHPTGSPMSPDDALRGFLDAYEVGADRRPASADAQAALYRSLLSGRRILVVLDNARDTEQVRPLLPAASTCLVVVTSRDRLAGLAALQGARPVALGLLTARESYDVLASRLGPDRMAEDPAAAEEIARYCAGLPLALSVVASRAATHPTIALTQLAAELRTTRNALEPLDLAGGEVGVRTALSWSVHQLSPAAAQMFRLLGVYPATEVTTVGAARVAAVEPAAARAALAELVRVHLLDEQAPGRYGHHDLIRAYAAELAEDLDASARHSAVERVLDDYAHTAYAAAWLLTPTRVPVRCPTRPAGVSTVDLADAAAALVWFTVERDALIDAVACAATTGFHSQASQLAWALFDFINRQGHWGQWVALQRLVLVASQRSGDAADEAYANYALGLTLVHVGETAEATLCLQRALELFQDLDDFSGAANTHLNLGGMAQLGGDYRAALDHADAARRLYAKANNRAGIARATNGLGWSTRSWATTPRRRRTSGRPWTCSASWATRRVRRIPGTAWGTSSIARLTMRRRNDAICAPSTCPERAATAITRPNCSTTSATTPQRRAPPIRPVTTLRPRWRSSMRSATRMPTGSARRWPPAEPPRRRARRCPGIGRTAITGETIPRRRGAGAKNQGGIVVAERRWGGVRKPRTLVAALTVAAAVAGLSPSPRARPSRTPPGTATATSGAVTRSPPSECHSCRPPSTSSTPLVPRTRSRARARAHTWCATPTSAPSAPSW